MNAPSRPALYRSKRAMSVTQTPARETQAQLRKLEAMSVNELREEHYRVMGVATRARNKRWLMKRIFFRVQELTKGLSVSEEARAKAQELAADLPVRTLPLSPLQLPEIFPEEPEHHPMDPRLPPINSTLTREHEGETHEVLVLKKGFSYRGEHYRSLSALARAISGTRWNGFTFFGLGGRKQPGESS